MPIHFMDGAVAACQKGYECYYYEDYYYTQITGESLAIGGAIVLLGIVVAEIVALIRLRVRR